jgi:hypothetical protein
MFFKLASQTFLTIAIIAISLQLLLDPWMAERFQRAMRENCRINNYLLEIDFHDRIPQVRDAMGALGLFFAFGSYLKYRWLSITLVSDSCSDPKLFYWPCTHSSTPTQRWSSTARSFARDTLR